MKVTLNEAKKIIENGGIIAYPTETTWGLGCNALNKKALMRLTQIKQRKADKGFIVLIHNHKQLTTLSPPLSKSQKQTIATKWPGPHTFIFPALPTLPTLLNGKNNGIAIRMSSHPVAHALSENSPITSTSANLSNQPTITNIDELLSTFGLLIDGIIDETPGYQSPSSITDIITGERFR